MFFAENVFSLRIRIQNKHCQLFLQPWFTPDSLVPRPRHRHRHRRRRPRPRHRHRRPTPFRCIYGSHSLRYTMYGSYPLKIHS